MIARFKIGEVLLTTIGLTTISDPGDDPVDHSIETW
jgi:hypothetical protein